MKTSRPSIWHEPATLLTAYLFSGIPFLLLFLLSLGLTHTLTTPFLGPRIDALRVAVYGAISLGIVYLTYRMRRVLQGFGHTEERYHRMIQTASDGIVILDRAGNYIDANEKATEMLGYSRPDLLRVNSRDTTPPGHEACVRPDGIEVGDTSGVSECMIRRKDGADLYVEASMTRLRDGTVMRIIRDVSERKRTQEALRGSEQKYKSLFDNNLAAVFRFTTQGTFLDCNNAFARIFSYSSIADVMTRSTAEFYFQPEAHDAFINYLREKGTLTDFEMFLRRSDDTPVWALANVGLIVEGNLEIVQGTLIDITERKRAEDQVSASLREKEVLLKEVHHRVKNNLQIISSLLSLQADYIDDSRALALFHESQERINSIALLHESLYRSDDLASIDIARYIHTLATNLTNTWGPASNARIKLNVQVSRLMLDLATAMPCALIVTELVTNSLKYAFPDERQGEIYINMAREDGAAIALTIGDTGVGLPPGTALGQSDSLGLQLVDTLIKQLKGTVAISLDHGTQFRISFTPPMKRSTL